MTSLPASADTYTVASLSAAIARAVSEAFPDQIWVRGEIRDLQRPNSGHVFFTLVDGDDERVRLSVTLFATERHLVNRVLTRSGGAVRMTDGVDVRIRGEVTHYAARGTVQVRMTMIDPDYTVGKLAAERARVLRSLAEAGLLERNRALPVPLVPLRIGLVTSRGSAAEADFRSSVAASGYRFVVVPVDARVQGVDAVDSLVAGLEQLDGAVDVVAVVRGGGSATDLAAFDDERLARRIAMMRTPVFTGIGHEIDRSVADEVAARSYKTPTEAAVAIIDIVAGFDRRLVATGRAVVAAARRGTVREAAAMRGRRERLARSGRHAVAAGRRHLEVVAGRISSGARRSVADAESAVITRSRHLVRAAPLALERAARDLRTRGERVEGVDPARLLARGWSITRGPDGSVVRSVDRVRAGDALVTRVAGGSVRSEVTEVEPVHEDDADRTDGAIE